MEHAECADGAGQGAEGADVASNTVGREDRGDENKPQEGRSREPRRLKRALKGSILLKSFSCAIRG